MITLNSNINLPMFPDPPWEQTSLDASQSLHCRDRWVNQGVCLELKVGESTKLNICESRRNGEEAQDKVQHAGHSWHGVCSRVRPSDPDQLNCLVNLYYIESEKIWKGHGTPGPSGSAGPGMNASIQRLWCLCKFSPF